MRKLLTILALFVVIALTGGAETRASAGELNAPVISYDQGVASVAVDESFIVAPDADNCSDDWCCSSSRCHNSCCAGALLTPALIAMDGAPDHSALLPRPQGLLAFAVFYSIIDPPRA